MGDLGIFYEGTSVVLCPTGPPTLTGAPLPFSRILWGKGEDRPGILYPHNWRCRMKNWQDEYHDAEEQYDDLQSFADFQEECLQGEWEDHQRVQQQKQQR